MLFVNSQVFAKVSTWNRKKRYREFLQLPQAELDIIVQYSQKRKTLILFFNWRLNVMSHNAYETFAKSFYKTLNLKILWYFIKDFLFRKICKNFRNFRGMIKGFTNFLRDFRETLFVPWHRWQRGLNGCVLGCHLVLGTWFPPRFHNNKPIWRRRMETGRDAFEFKDLIFALFSKIPFF